MSLEEEKSTTASSSRKVLRILFAFSEQRLEATVPELAELAGASLPSTYRHVALLKELQLVEEGGPGKYHPTAKVMPLARAAQLSNDIGLVSKPIVAAAAGRLHETVMLFQHFGDSVVCVELTEYNRPMRFTFERGHSVPLGMGASGKMVLALLPEHLRRIALDRWEGSANGLRQELDGIASRQYAISRGEVDEGVWACSVPVTAVDRPLVLTMAGPAARINDAARTAALEELRNSAGMIKAELGRYAL